MIFGTGNDARAVTSSKGYALKDHSCQRAYDVNETNSRRQAAFFLFIILTLAKRTRRESDGEEDLRGFVCARLSKSRCARTRICWWWRVDPSRSVIILAVSSLSRRSAKKEKKIRSPFSTVSCSSRLARHLDVWLIRDNTFAIIYLQ